MDKEGREFPGTSHQDVDDFADIYEGLADGSTTWLEVPLGWEIEQLKLGDPANNPEALLAYCDSQIRTVFLAQLLGAEATRVGLSGALGQLLYNSIDGIASWMAEVLNGQPGRATTGLIKPMIDANISHDGTLRYPRLVARGLEHQDTRAWVDSVTKALQFGAMWYSASVEDEMRRALDMPPLSPTERDMRESWSSERFLGEVASVTSAPATPADLPGLGGASGEGGTRASEVDTQARSKLEPAQTDVVDPDGV